MKSFAFSIALASCLALAAPAFAESVQAFYKGTGWEPGDESQTAYEEGLSFGFTIDRSSNSGSMYVKGRFCNEGSTVWVGGIRVTDDEPDEAHATLRIQPGDCKVWGEHLEFGVTRLWMLVDRNDQ